MRTIVACLLTAAIAMPLAGANAAEKPPAAVKPATAQKPAAAHGAAPVTEDDRTLYALGLVIGRSLEPFSLSPKELAQVKAGMENSVSHGKPAVDLAVYGPKIQELQKSRQSVSSAKERAAGAAYLESAAKEAGAVRTPAGAIVKTLTEGTGASPAASDQVKVHYEGKLVDGTIFDSSIKRGTPATFALNRVIPCWTESVPTMKVGGRARVVCPAELAYGDRGSGPLIHPGATLVFEIELLDVIKDTTPKEAPAASAPAASAPTTGAPPAGGQPAAAPK